MRDGKRKRPWRKHASGKGLVVTEMAIILPVMMLMIFGILDFGRLYFTQITLQHAMREGGRFGVTGQQLPDPNEPQALLSRIASIRQVVHDAAVGVGVEPGDIIVNSIGGGNGNAGGPGDTLTISMSYTFRFITPMVGQFFNNGEQHFTVSTSFRNEPFPPGNRS